MRTKTIALLLSAVSLLAAGRADANFEDFEAGARGLSMGGAFVAVPGDPASVFWNPAAILGEERVQITGMRTRLYDGLEGLTEDFVGVSGQVGEGTAVGFGWTRTGLENIYHEDTLTLAGAYRVPGTSLVLGVSGLMYGIDAPGYEELNDPNYLGRQWEPSFSLGALYEITENFTLGASVENVLRPEMQLLSNTTDVDPIGGRRRIGLAYLVQSTIRITFEARHLDLPDWYNNEFTLHAGAESWFSDVLALRVGVNAGDLTAGAGLVVRDTPIPGIRTLRFDGGMITNERLGNTFRAAVTLGF